MDHFRTSKGKGIFLNKFFLAKLVLLAAGAWLFVLPMRGRTGFFDSNSIYDFVAGYRLPLMGFIGITLAIYGFEAVYTAYSFVKGRLLHPDLTKKSVMLIGAAHTVMYGVSLAAFFVFLGELRLLDLCFAAFSLLLLDIMAPVLIGAVVLGLQPLTLIEKAKILKRARAIIDSRPDLTVIGVAGSYGKSVTKELLAHILSQNYKVLKTRANQNTEMGVSQTVINDLKPEHQIFVCEIGAVHKGRIAQVAGIVKPKIGILTGINQQHQAVFGSLQNIIDAKYEVLEALPETGTAVLNFKSDFVLDSFDTQRTRIKAKKLILAGKDISIEKLRVGIDELSFGIGYQGKSYEIVTNARGAFMAEPTTLSVAGAVAAGMNLADAVKIVNQTDFKPFNIEVLKNAAGFSVISSTYSANPSGVAGHLEYLKLWPGKKIIIMPCLIELGSVSKGVHFTIGKKIGKVCDLAIITTKDRFNDIKEGAVSAGMEPKNIFFCDNEREIGDIINKRQATDDVVLLEGRISKSLIALIKNKERR